MKQTIFYTSFAAIGGFFISLLGGMDTALSVLFTLIIVDYILGVVNAAFFKKSKKTCDGRLSSESMSKGLIKKGVTLLLVLVAYQLDRATDMNIIRSGVIAGFSASETLSILETVGLMGVKYPAIIKNAITVLRSSSEKSK